MKYEKMDVEILRSAAESILDEFIRGGLKVVYHCWGNKHDKAVDGWNSSFIWDPNNSLTVDRLGVREWKFVAPDMKEHVFEEDGVTNLYPLSDREKEFVLRLLELSAGSRVIPIGPALTHPAADEWRQEDELVNLAIYGKALIRDDIVARRMELDPEQRKNIVQNEESYLISVPESMPILHIFFDSVSGKMRKKRIRLDDLEPIEESIWQDVYLDNVIIGDYNDEDIERMVASLLKDGEEA